MSSLLPLRRSVLRSQVLGLALFVWSMLCAAVTPGAQAQTGSQPIDDQRARAHFFAGESHYAAERWADAEREFSLAYELSQRPEMLVNLSRAQERNGQLEGAVSSLELLLAKYPTTAYGGEAKLRIEAMRKQIAERAPEPAPTPAPAPVAEPPPPEAVPAVPAVTVPVEPAQNVMQTSRWTPSTLTLSVAGGALVMAVTSLATGLRANHLYDQLDARCPSGTCSGSFESRRDHGHALARASTATMFISLGAAAGAAVLWVYDIKRHDRQSGVAFGIDGLGARVRARF